MTARQKLGELLERVRLLGERIVVERTGRPMAVIVPVEFCESWERRRAELFRKVDQARAKNRKSSAAVVDRDVTAAQRAVRRRGISAHWTAPP